MESVRVCGFCNYWMMGIPCGSCRHPDVFWMPTGDTMVFINAGASCPLNKRGVETEKIDMHKDFESYLKQSGVTSDPFISENIVYNRLYAEYKKYGSLIIAYDFDYTVHSFRGEQIEYSRVMDLLRAWRTRGKFICFTASPEDRYAYIREYCEKFDLPLDAINEDVFVRKYTRKVYYNVFLDDRAGLEQTVKLLEDLLCAILKEET